uniref:Disease resistance N-terminal domain-containing protein n=1 Tax=Oryza meridionalis TaxID=40149 RepID=A0A0E0EAR7_9ORYZ
MEFSFEEQEVNGNGELAMILSAFVSACASKLAGLIADRSAAGLGVEDDVRSMQRRMERVGAVLADAERRRRRRTGEHEAASAGAWIDGLRDFLYDADDVLDLCRCRGDRILAERRPRSRPLMAPVNLVSSLQKLQARLEIGAQITRLNLRFEDICKDRLFLSLAVDDSKAENGGSRGGGGGGSRVRTRTSTPLLETNVVGKEIKSATEALVEKIMRDDGRGEVVAVVGMLRDLQHLSRRESICGDLQAVGSSSLIKLRRLSLMNLEQAMVPCNAISRDRKCFRTLSNGHPKG